MADRIPVFHSGGQHRRDRAAAVIAHGLDTCDLIARADREVELFVAELASVRVERDKTRSQLDELRVAYDQLHANVALTPQFSPEWVEYFKAKDEIIARLTLGYKESRQHMWPSADSRAADSQVLSRHAQNGISPHA